MSAPLAPDHLDEVLNIDDSRRLREEEARILARLDDWKITLFVAGLSEHEALTCIAGVRADVLASEDRSEAA